MTDNFDKFIERVGIHEAGYTNNPKDKGNWTGGVIGVGELKGTKFGIAANTYGHLDIKNLTWEQAKEIYRKDFWEGPRINELQAPLAFQVLDAAINHGRTRAIGWMQSVVGATSDGRIGPLTLNRVNAYVEVHGKMAANMLFLASRLQFFTDLPTFDTFGKGWARRIVINMRYAVGD